MHGVQGQAIGRRQAHLQNLRHALASRLPQDPTGDARLRSPLGVSRLHIHPRLRRRRRAGRKCGGRGLRRPNLEDPSDRGRCVSDGPREGEEETGASERKGLLR